MRLFLIFLMLPGVAHAHASEQGLVMLLPTGVYSFAGAAVVAATVLLLVFVPRVENLFRPIARLRCFPSALWRGTGILSLGLLVLLLGAGLFGPTDPLRNPLVLVVWTLFWSAVVVVQGVVFDLWRWLNPFTAAARLGAVTGVGPLARMPGVGHLPALVLFMAFAGFLLADPAPADPRRLAVVVGSYLVGTLLMVAIFGPRWLVRGETITVFLRAYRRVAVSGGGRLGCPGWRLATGPAPGTMLAVFLLGCLAVGSFDGLNETFAWLGFLGVNPLEFPGRSALVLPTLLGLLASVAALVVVYTAAIWAGLRLAGDGSLTTSFRVFAPSLLPIAVGYHFAHYLPGFLVDVQYLASFLSQLAGQGAHHVTTGFFNSLASVRAIWLAEAGAVVLGHVIAVLVAHALALRLYGDRRRAVLSQMPLAIFMIGYTFFGLWLLAAPKGA